MKSLKILAICLCLGISMSYAQQRGGNVDPATRAKTTVEHLTKELGLNKTQQDSIYNYILKQTEHQKAQFEKNKDKREDVRAELQNERTKKQEKIKSFLTAEQKSKYEALEAKQEGRGFQGRKN